MICQVIRNKETNEIDRVLAPNGENSILYKDLLNITKNKEDAFKLWTKVYTPTFKEWFGDWLNKPQSVKNIDNNGEPKLINNSYINFKNQNYPVINSIGKLDNLQYQFKLVDKILSNFSKVNDWFKQLGNNDKFWQKLQQDLQIPKEQIALLKELADPNTARISKSYSDNFIEQLLLDFVANYSYTVEVDTAKEQYLGNEWQIEQVDEGYDAVNKYTKERKFFIEVEDAYSFIGDNKVLNKPTQHYSNLTVPGGTNYTENEIATPAITPSIKGHATFSTNSGIGWFRSDEKQNYTEQDIDTLINNMKNSGVLEINCS